MAKRDTDALAEAEAILGMPVNTAKALLDTFADLYPGAREAIMQARQTKKQKTFDVSEYTRMAKQILQPYAPNFDAETSAKSLRDLISSAKALIPVNAGNALSALTKIALEAEAGEKKCRSQFAELMHYCPMHDRRHYNVGRELRDAIRAACSKCDSQTMAEVIAMDIPLLIDDIKEEYTDGDAPADLDAQVHARVILEIEDSFFSALAGDDGFGTEDDF
jgi:hypothetical protein